MKKIILTISQNSHENTCATVSFLIKLQDSGKEKSLAQVFSYKFCEIPKNTFSYRTPLVTASKITTIIFHGKNSIVLLKKNNIAYLIPKSFSCIKFWRLQSQDLKSLKKFSRELFSQFPSNYKIHKIYFANSRRKLRTSCATCMVIFDFDLLSF